jgi:hypothetical protein
MKANRFETYLGVTVMAVGLGVGLGVVAQAGPLQRSEVPADAKWVLHLDLDAFRAAQVGDYLIRARIEKDMARVRGDLKTYLDFDFDWTQINGLTAFGTDLGRGGKARAVLLIHTALDVAKGFEAAIAKQAQAGVEGSVTRTLESPVPIYSVREELFVAAPAGKAVVVAKTREQLDKGLGVVTGQVTSLASTPAFLDFPPTPAGLIFLGMASGIADETPLPPQAKVLKMTDAGQVVLGESGTQVFLIATLKAKSAEVSAQMQQVLQGLIALGALGQPENPDLLQLIQLTRVTANDRLVTVSVELPVATVTQKLEARQKR